MNKATQLLAQELETTRGQLHEEWFSKLEKSDQKPFQSLDAATLEVIKENSFHFEYLGESLRLEEPLLFRQYLQWTKKFLQAREVDRETRIGINDLFRQSVQKTFARKHDELFDTYVGKSISVLEQDDEKMETFFGPDNPLPDLASEYLESLLEGDRKRASRMIMDATENGIEVAQIYMHVFQASQKEIGRLWLENQVTVAQEHFCTAATQLIMSQLYPKIFSSPRNGRVLVGACIGDELHEIGGRMVIDFFEMEGWDTHYLGANNPPSQISDEVGKTQPDLVALSVTMAFNLHLLQQTVEKIHEVEPDLPILVGGAAFSGAPELAEEVGASALAGNAEEALKAGRRLVETK